MSVRLQGFEPRRQHLEHVAGGCSPRSLERGVVLHVAGVQHLLLFVLRATIFVSTKFPQEGAKEAGSAPGGKGSKQEPGTKAKEGEKAGEEGEKEKPRKKIVSKKERERLRKEAEEEEERQRVAALKAEAEAIRERYSSPDLGFMRSFYPEAQVVHARMVDGKVKRFCGSGRPRRPRVRHIDKFGLISYRYFELLSCWHHFL